MSIQKTHYTSPLSRGGRGVHHYQSNTRIGKYDLRKEVMNSAPEWVTATPYSPRQLAVFEAWLAFKKTKDKTKPKYRSCRRPSKTIRFQKSNWKNNTFYPQITKGLTFLTRESLPSIMLAEPTLSIQNGQWFITYHIESKLLPLGNLDVISLDPGIRTFLTGFDGQQFIELGKGDIGRIQRLCHHLDNLISKRNLAKGKSNKRYRYKLKQAERKIRWRIRNLIDELHRKIAHYLTNNYGLIFLPKFESQQMVCKGKRKLNRKSVRNLLTFAHYRFKQTLKYQAAKKGCVVVDVTEEYTSKTCSVCGHVHTKLGGHKKFVCPSCGHTMDRDKQGAFNIMLKALRDTSATVNLI